MLARDVIDFTLERSRHTSFSGREDVLAAIDATLSDAVKARGAGFIVLKGGPGMGKSAILHEWLRRREEQGCNEHGRNPQRQDEQGRNEQGRNEQGGNPRSQGEPGMGTPRHFIRRGQGSNNQPDVVVRNLVAQIAALHPGLVEAEPALVDPELTPQRQLEKLLLAVSQARLSHAIAPECGDPPLVLLIDGLDEADVDPSRKHDNPVERMLPYRLPPGVVVVVASRPRYPHLGWLEQHDQAAPPLDLDSGEWSASNHAAVEGHWAHFGPRFSPPLAPGFVKAAVERAQGNLLHAERPAPAPGARLGRRLS